MNYKKILKITSIILLVISLALAILCLVQYYKYIGVINKLKDNTIDFISKSPSLRKRVEIRAFAMT